MDGQEPRPIARACIEESCGKAFTITVGEQRFYVSKAMDLPKRCAECRRMRKATINRAVRHVSE